MPKRCTYNMCKTGLMFEKYLECVTNTKHRTELARFRRYHFLSVMCSLFSICNVFFVSKSNHLDFYFNSLQLVLELYIWQRRLNVAVVKHLPIHHHSADYICISFGIIEPIMVALKMEFCSCIR